MSLQLAFRGLMGGTIIAVPIAVVIGIAIGQVVVDPDRINEATLNFASRHVFRWLAAVGVVGGVGIVVGLILQRVQSAPFRGVEGLASEPGVRAMVRWWAALLILGAAAATFFGALSPWLAALPVPLFVGLLFQPPRETEPELTGEYAPSAAAAQPARPDPATWWEGILRGPLYRGQILTREVRKARSPTLGDLDRLDPVLQLLIQRSGLESRFYTHLDTILTLMTGPGADKAAIVTQAPLGAGTDEAVNLLAAHALAARHERTLIVCPDEARVQSVANGIREFIEGLHGWSSIASVAAYGDVASVPATPSRMDIVIVSPEALDQLLRIARDEWHRFFINLGLVVVRGADEFVGVPGAHVSMEFRRLEALWRQLGQRPRYLVECPYVRNPRSFVATLLGEPIEDPNNVIQAAGTPRAAITLAGWTPAVQNVDGDARTLHRSSVHEEVVNLGASALGAGLDVVVVLATTDVTTDDIVGLRTQIQRRNPEAGDIGRLEVVGRMAAAALPPTKFDVAIYAGLPGNLARLEHEIAQLGVRRPSGKAVAVVVTPVRAWTLLHPGLNGSAPPAPVAHAHTSNEHISQLHARALIGSGDYDESELEEVLGASLAAEAWQVVLRGNRPDQRLSPLAVDERSRVLQPAPGQLSYFEPRLGLESTGEAVVDVVDTANPDVLLARLDPRRALEFCYPRALFFSGLARYRVIDTAADLAGLRSGGQIRVSGSGGPAGSTTHRLSTSSVRRAPPDFEASELGWTLTFGEVTVNEQLLGFGEILGEESRKSIWKIDQAVLSREVHTEGFALLPPEGTNEAVLHTIAHAARIVLNQRVAQGVTDLGTAVVANFGEEATAALVMYDGVPGGIGLARHIHDAWPDVASECVDFLLACPCMFGCAACIVSATCKSGASVAQLDKRGALEALAEYVGGQQLQEANARIETRYNDIDDGAMRRPTAILHALAGQLLPEMLQIGISQRGLPRLAWLPSRERSELLGRYNGSEHLIELKQMSEREIIGTIAHELAHAWEYFGDDGGADLNVLAAKEPTEWSHVFIEGFAQWLEFRVLDHYGFRDELEEIANRYADPYGVGFRLFFELEREVGALGVVRWMRQPDFDWLDRYVRGSPKFLSDVAASSQREPDWIRPPNPASED